MRRAELVRATGLPVDLWPWSKAFLVTLVLLSGSGCSIKLAYNNADRLIRWSIDDYIDFDRSQKQFVTAELERILYWHRTTQLPLYATALRRLNEDVALARGGPQAQLEENFAGFVETALNWGDAVERKARRTGNQVLLSLSAEQIATLPEKLDKDNRKLLKDELGKSEARNQQRWAKEVRKGLQRFTGRLSDAQLQFLTEQSLSYVPERQLWIDYRKRWQAAVLELLQRWQDGQLENDAFVNAFRNLADDRESYYGDFGPVWRQNEALALATLAGILVRMSPEQQARFSERLLAIADDLDELVEEADFAPPDALVAADCLVPHHSCPGTPINPSP